MKIPKPKKAPSLKALRSKADGLWQQAGFKVWGDKCTCGNPAYCCHHFYPKGQYGHLRYELCNAVPICNGCHFAIHTKQDIGVVMNIRKRRGEDWFKVLSTEADKTPSSYRGMKWYKAIIDFLTSIIDGTSKLTL